MAEIEIIELRRGRTQGLCGAGWAGSQQVTQYELLLQRGDRHYRRHYRALAYLLHPSDLPPVHGEPTTDPPVVSWHEIRLVGGGYARGAVRRELLEAASRAVLADWEAAA